MVIYPIGNNDELFFVLIVADDVLERVIFFLIHLPLTHYTTLLSTILAIKCKLCIIIIFFIFTGSSTELAPSVIGYYDRLSTGIDDIISLPISESKVNEKLEPTTIKSSYSASVPTKIHISTPPTQNSINQQKHKNFGFLSQNVQRIISHSGSDGDILETHRKIDQETSTHLINTTKYFKRIGSLKNKYTNIPLSRNTCKLTQAGNELVDTLDAKPFSSSDSINDLVEKKKISKAIPSSHEPPKIVKSKNIQKIIQRLQSVNGNQADDDIDENIINMSTNGTNLNDGQQPGEPITEAVNYLVQIPTDLVEGRDFQKLKISDTNNEQIQTDETAPIPPTIDSILDNGSISNANQVEHEDLSTQRISLPKDVTESPFNNKSSLTIPDIARLKHRPLSASSICSTSSSSSSGSENMTSKIGISYLASVESLADHSENELVSGNMTLCERACREIIDSERTYVEDLGQVIKG